jgi:hypothetical protein
MLRFKYDKQPNSDRKTTPKIKVHKKTSSVCSAFSTIQNNDVSSNSIEPQVIDDNNERLRDSSIFSKLRTLNLSSSPSHFKIQSSRNAKSSQNVSVLNSPLSSSSYLPDTNFSNAVSSFNPKFNKTSTLNQNSSTIFSTTLYTQKNAEPSREDELQYMKKTIKYRKLFLDKDINHLKIKSVPKLPKNVKHFETLEDINLRSLNHNNDFEEDLKKNQFPFIQTRNSNSKPKFFFKIAEDKQIALDSIYADNENQFRRTREVLDKQKAWNVSKYHNIIINGMKGKISDENFRVLKVGLEEVHNLTTNRGKSCYNNNKKFNRWDYIFKKNTGFIRDGLISKC